jgi:hypothetical protein
MANKREQPTRPPPPPRERTTVPPHQIVPFPSLSPTMTHGGIASWKKAEGEFVAAGDILVGGCTSRVHTRDT